VATSEPKMMPSGERRFRLCADDSDLFHKKGEDNTMLGKRCCIFIIKDIIWVNLSLTPWKREYLCDWFIIVKVTPYG
jgi:hypothetical protein